MVNSNIFENNVWGEGFNYQLLPLNSAEWRKKHAATPNVKALSYKMATIEIDILRESPGIFKREIMYESNLIPTESLTNTK